MCQDVGVTSTGRSYQGLSADQRRARRRAQLLEAGLDLLGTEGAQATTVRAVCRRTKLTPRYFYENFADLDTLLLAIFDNIVEEITERTLAAAPGTVRETLRALITAQADIVAEDPRKGRAVFVEALGSEAIMRRRLEAMRGIAVMLAEQAAAGRKLPGRTRRAVDRAGHIVAGGLIECLITWVDDGLEGSRQELIEDFTELSAATFNAALGNLSAAAPTGRRRSR